MLQPAKPISPSPFLPPGLKRTHGAHRRDCDRFLEVVPRENRLREKGESVREVRRDAAGERDGLSYSRRRARKSFITRSLISSAALGSPSTIRNADDPISFRSNLGDACERWIAC